MEKAKEVFDNLYSQDVSKVKKQKNNLDYLSWATAWGLLKQHYPNASYEIEFFDGKPYIYDESMGYLVFTNVTVEGQTHRMWLAVMDYRNQAILKPKSTDINKSIMRCLAKNIAMFGLGLTLYTGEDLLDDDPTPAKNKANEVKKIDSEKLIDDVIKKAKDAGIEGAELKGFCEMQGVNTLKGLTPDSHRILVKAISELKNLGK